MIYIKIIYIFPFFPPVSGDEIERESRRKVSLSTRREEEYHPGKEKRDICLISFSQLELSYIDEEVKVWVVVKISRASVI